MTVFDGQGTSPIRGAHPNLGAEKFGAEKFGVGNLDAEDLGAQTSGASPLGLQPLGVQPSGVQPSRITLLVSKISGGGRAVRLGHQVANILRQGRWDVSVRQTDESDFLPEVVASVDGDLIGVVGGDGYLATIAASVAGDLTKVLVPFPGGRGNDLCRALGLGTSAVKRAQALANLTETDWGAHLRQIDGMWVSSRDFPEPKFALGIVSLAIDAAANQIANQSTLRWGPIAYAWGALQAFVRHKFWRVTGVIDGEKYDFSGWIHSVSNSGWMGGGINLVPGTALDDGYLKIVTVPATHRLRVLPLLVRALLWGVPQHPLITVRRGKEVFIDAEIPLPGMADGDFIGRTPLEIHAAPKAVTVLT